MRAEALVKIYEPAWPQTCNERNKQSPMECKQVFIFLILAALLFVGQARPSFEEVRCQSCRIAMQLLTERSFDFFPHVWPGIVIRVASCL